eukprot:TRINITY_DN10432_c0_g1_i1.p1 TRINITY_DN10432_c0_g1~~TRINITY_DN10432_c0_g1_i1.p1  ORF type:complete len:247 (-),score=37.49 TRINITY_DN10432_c0_g1_i1:69-809(-)
MELDHYQGSLCGRVLPAPSAYCVCSDHIPFLDDMSCKDEDATDESSYDSGSVSSPVSPAQFYPVDISSNSSNKDLIPEAGSFDDISEFLALLETIEPQEPLLPIDSKLDSQPPMHDFSSLQDSIPPRQQPRVFFLGMSQRGAFEVLNHIPETIDETRQLIWGEDGIPRIRRGPQTFQLHFWENFLKRHSLISEELTVIVSLLHSGTVVEHFSIFPTAAFRVNLETNIRSKINQLVISVRYPQKFGG